MAASASRPRIVCAMDKFKGSLSAAQAGAALAAGVADSGHDLDVQVLPIADGGDGTVAAALASGMCARRVDVSGPTGEPIRATIAVRRGRAVVELANCCGLALSGGAPPRPFDAHTVGLGLAMRSARSLGCDQIVAGVGGSASIDLGLGALVGLGARLLDARGGELRPCPRDHLRLAAIDLEPVRRSFQGVTVRVASDVDNPLLGSDGAVAVFGPQKGVGAGDAAMLEEGLAHAVEVLERETGTPVAARPAMGAGGGVPAALVAVLDAEMVSGARWVLDLVGLERALVDAELVITGEGSFDGQTMHGKAPVEVLRSAREQGTPAAVVAGRVEMEAAALRRLGVRRAWALIDRARTQAEAIALAAGMVREIGGELARWWAAGSPG